MARVPFLPNTELALPGASFEGWLASRSPRRRERIRRSRRRFARAGGKLEVVEDLVALAPPLHALYDRTCADHRRRGDLPVPIPIGRTFFAALDGLPRPARRVLYATVDGRPAGFLLAVRSGDQLALKTCGLDPELARPSEAYLMYAGIELALAWVLRSVDLGTTTFTFKEALGAVLQPTHYHLRFSRWYLRPLGAALRRSYGRTSAPADA